MDDITTTNNYASEEYSYQEGFETVEYNMISINIADVTHQNNQRKDIFTKINVKLPELPNNRTEQLINMKVNTGAMGSTLPLRSFCQMMPEKLGSDGLPNKDVANRAKNTALLAYNKTHQVFMGVSTCSVTTNGGLETFQFHIVDVPSPAVCG